MACKLLILGMQTGESPGGGECACRCRATSVTHSLKFFQEEMT